MLTRFWSTFTYNKMWVQESHLLMWVSISKLLTIRNHYSLTMVWSGKRTKNIKSTLFYTKHYKKRKKKERKWKDVAIFFSGAGELGVLGNDLLLQIRTHSSKVMDPLSPNWKSLEWKFEAFQRLQVFGISIFTNVTTLNFKYFLVFKTWYIIVSNGPDLENFVYLLK